MLYALGTRWGLLASPPSLAERRRTPKNLTASTAYLNMGKHVTLNGKRYRLKDQQKNTVRAVWSSKPMKIHYANLTCGCAGVYDQELGGHYINKPCATHR